MALFEVFIPAREASSPNVTLSIEATNWIGALRSGLKSIGEGQEAIANVMCDIKEDNSIHVTDVATRRVFRLREVKPEDPKTQPEGPRPVSLPDEQAITQKNERPPDLAAPAPKTLIEFPAPPTMTMTPPAQPRHIPDPRQKATPAPVSTPEVAKPPPPPPSTGPQERQVARPSPTLDPDTLRVPASTIPSDTERVERPKAARISSPPTPRGVPAPAPKRPSGQFSDAAAPKARTVTQPNAADPKIGRPDQKPVDVQEAIAAVFDATQDLYMEVALSGQQVADKLLDIALSHIPAEAGTFYLADVNGHELTFTAVRGPKADALKRSGMTVKVGQGIIGFCAQEGICLAVSDIQKDPRFLASIARTIDYQPTDTLCASAEKDGRLYGAVQVMNSKSGFDAAHMEVLRFIGLTAAAILERVAEGA